MKFGSTEREPSTAKPCPEAPPNVEVKFGQSRPISRLRILPVTTPAANSVTSSGRKELPCRPINHATVPVTRSLDPTGAGRAGWTMWWKPSLNALAVTFDDRFPSAETYRTS
ncbi:MAG: transposase mutator type [Frankiales bacterium]|nr:transposase mutator type [Frankiales bacterium]